jgi:hypothetical protein
MAISAVVLGAVLLIPWRGRASDPAPSIATRRALVRLAGAGVLTLGLSAITLVPLWVQRDYIVHPFVPVPEPVLSLRRVLERYFVADAQDPYLVHHLVFPQTYYHFVSPWWYVALVFALFPRTYRRRRLWIAGGLLLVLFTSWGAGANPVINRMYAEIGLFHHWRYIGRVLAVGAFWLAVLIALRADDVMHALGTLPRQQPRVPHTAIRLLQIALVLVTLGAACDLLAAGQQFTLSRRAPANRSWCVDWLRAQHPKDELSVFAYSGFESAAVFLENHVRLSNIEVLFDTDPRPSTIGDLALIDLMLEYGIAHNTDEVDYLLAAGYEPVEGSPPAYGAFPCLYARSDALRYAFSVPLSRIDAATPDTLPESLPTTPLDVAHRTPDRITLRVTADPTQPEVVVIQELAYPGWRVWIDDQPARLESVGGWSGVILPPDGETHTVRFAFRPTLFYRGAGVTLASILACVIYLLRKSRLHPPPHE